MPSISFGSLLLRRSTYLHNFHGSFLLYNAILCLPLFKNSWYTFLLVGWSLYFSFHSTAPLTRTCLCHWIDSGLSDPWLPSWSFCVRRYVEIVRSEQSHSQCAVFYVIIFPILLGCFILAFSIIDSWRGFRFMKHSIVPVGGANLYFAQISCSSFLLHLSPSRQRCISTYGSEDDRAYC